MLLLKLSTLIIIETVISVSWIRTFVAAFLDPGLTFSYKNTYNFWEIHTSMVLFVDLHTVHSSLKKLKNAQLIT
jgi:hypothetical protein